ncbi:MAG: 1,4-dihydroxy-2-naphthoate polyprenyltransferase [Nocardioidaceae bacterium]
MATLAQWAEGARPRTLPAAVAPVVLGTGAAIHADGEVWWRAGLALVVALALQIGVNYANDYSDGIRGTDDVRAGPLRLVGSRVASPGAVKLAAFVSFGVGAMAGLVLAATSGWWLIAVGAVAIVAAWFYTGGDRPYGYRALGEVSVFVFFGVVAVVGTTYVQVGEATWPSIAGAVGVGAVICAILVANNLRDIPTDAASGKRTLAVRLGDAGTRWLYLALLAVAFAALVWLAFLEPWTLLGLVAVAPALRAYGPVRTSAVGPALIPVLRDTGLTALVYAVAVAVGLAMS